MMYNSQVIMHPFVVYYKSKDEMKHDTLAVHTLINKGMPYIRKKLPLCDLSFTISVMDVEDNYNSY